MEASDDWQGWHDNGGGSCGGVGLDGGGGGCAAAREAHHDAKADRASTGNRARAACAVEPRAEPAEWPRDFARTFSFTGTSTIAIARKWARHFARTLAKFFAEPEPGFARESPWDSIRAARQWGWGGRAECAAYDDSGAAGTDAVLLGADVW